MAKGKLQQVASEWLDGVYTELSPAARRWAERPDVRASWMDFALSHARLEKRGVPTSPAEHLVAGIERSYSEHNAVSLPPGTTGV